MTFYHDILKRSEEYLGESFSKVVIFSVIRPKMAYLCHFLKIFPTDFLGTHLGQSFGGWATPLESGNADAFLFWGLY